MEGKLDEERVLQFDVPLGVLPAVFPPGTGERKGAACFVDLALVGAGEEGERVMKTASFFGRNIDWDGRALALEGEMVNGGNFGNGRGFEIERDGCEGDDIGAVGVELMRDAEMVWPDDSGEPAQGVGEFVGIFETAREELVLGVAREGWDEFKVEFLHGCGGFDGIEMSVQRAEKDIGRERGFGEDELTGVGGSVFEGEGELEFGRGALVMVKAVAESLQEAFRHKKERLVAFDGRLELVGDAVVVLGAVELEKAVVFTMGNVVESGEFLAQALGKALARKFGEIAEGLESPELKNGGVGKRKGLGKGEIGELESERGVFRGKGGEMGEVGGLAEADLERESEVFGSV